MVTRGTYCDENEHFARRYSSRGHGYPPNHEREQPLLVPHHASYARHNMSSHNINNRQSPEQDANSAPRRRIPVACGRCRKRKIRCSGDPGNGQPCINCKTAGTETCQFLRVSSTEATLKNDGNDFNYDSSTTAVSRVHCRMSPYGPSHPSYNPHVAPLGPDAYSSYRHTPLSAYQPIKYYGISSYNDFADENVDYGLPASNYSIINQESIGIPYTSIGSTRAWAQPQAPKTGSLFVEDSSYNHLPSYSNLPYRPNMNPESKSLSLHSMANALSPSVSGTDRVLPAPAPVHYRTPQVAGSYLRSAENTLPVSQTAMFNNGLMSTQMVNAVKALSASSSNESMASSTYLPLSSSPPESVPSSHMSYGTHSVSSAQNHDSYSHSQASQQPVYSHTNHSSSDVNNYAISQPSNSPHRLSISSLNGDESQTPSNNRTGSLVNGYIYNPPTSDLASYPVPQPIIPIREQPAPPPIQSQSVPAT